MKKNLKYIIPAVLILIVLVVLTKIVGKSSSSDPRRQSIPLVQVEQPHRETVVYKLKFTGDVLPIQQANIFSKVTGNLDRVYADMGDRVRRNQLLALIDTTELSQQFQQASATYQNARLNYERTKELAEQNLVARQDLDNAETTMKVARANYEGAATRLDFARITAPFSGYVTKRYLDPGAVLTSTNATLFTLMDIDEMKIIVSVLEKDIPLITIGKKAVITVDAYPGKEFVGTTTRYSQAVDLSTRTMAIEIDIPNNDHALKPGMFAAVTVIVDEHRNAVTVPTQALLRDDKGYFVLAVNNATVQRKDVTLGIEQEGHTEISSGLDGSESVITTGQQFVRDGAQVQIQQ
jgi:RND family efflux transporter MFP subunit